MNHKDQPVIKTGAEKGAATTAMIMIHGRGASAESILELSEEVIKQDMAYLAPQAPGHAWYPESFLAPIAQNEPGITTGIALIGSIIADLESNWGISTDQIYLLGFSQGACLALEYAARNAKRYGGVIALSGGVIGPDSTPRDYAGSMEQTSVFLGCSDVDSHVPLPRVKLSTKIFKDLNAKVTERIYPGMPHTVNQDEINWIRDLLELNGN